MRQWNEIRRSPEQNVIQILPSKNKLLDFRTSSRCKPRSRRRLERAIDGKVLVAHAASLVACSRGIENRQITQRYITSFVSRGTESIPSRSVSGSQNQKSSIAAPLDKPTTRCNITSSNPTL